MKARSRRWREGAFLEAAKRSLYVQRTDISPAGKSTPTGEKGQAESGLKGEVVPPIFFRKRKKMDREQKEKPGNCCKQKG